MKQGIILGLFAFLLIGLQMSNAQEKYILDADTANEMDDFYAIVKAIIDPEIELISLNSAQFNNT